MASGSISADKAVAVTIYRRAAQPADGRALRIGDALVHLARCGLAVDHERYGFFGGQVPGMIKIEIRMVPRHQLRVRQPRARVLRRITGDSTGGAHRLLQGVRAQVRAAAGAPAGAEVNGDLDPL